MEKDFSKFTISHKDMESIRLAKASMEDIGVLMKGLNKLGEGMSLLLIVFQKNNKNGYKKM